MREGFVFYKSFLGLFRVLKKPRRWQLFEALCAYAFDGEVIELPSELEALMSAMKPQIDANNRRYENGKKGAAYGIMGGRPKKEKEENFETPDITPKEKDNIKEKEKVNAKVNVKENGGGLRHIASDGGLEAFMKRKCSELGVDIETLRNSPPD